VKREITNSTRNKKNINFAIPAAPAAIPPNPNIAATIATIKNIIVQRNITLSFYETWYMGMKTRAIRPLVEFA
jgi:hypothetical protein